LAAVEQPAAGEEPAVHGGGGADVQACSPFTASVIVSKRQVADLYEAHRVLEETRLPPTYT